MGRRGPSGGWRARSGKVWRRRGGGWGRRVEGEGKRALGRHRGHRLRAAAAAARAAVDRGGADGCGAGADDGGGDAGGGGGGRRGDAAVRGGVRPQDRQARPARAHTQAGWIGGSREGGGVCVGGRAVRGRGPLAGHSDAAAAADSARAREGSMRDFVFGGGGGSKGGGGCRPVDAARGLEDRLRAERDKYFDRIRRGLDGLEEEARPLPRSRHSNPPAARLPSLLARPALSPQQPPLPHPPAHSDLLARLSPLQSRLALDPFWPCPPSRSNRPSLVGALSPSLPPSLSLSPPLPPSPPLPLAAARFTLDSLGRAEARLTPSCRIPDPHPFRRVTPLPRILSAAARMGRGGEDPGGGVRAEGPRPVPPARAGRSAAAACAVR